jgi:hypothetical protein
MIKHLFIVILFLFSSTIFAQIKPIKGKGAIKGVDGGISNRLGSSKLDSLANSDEFKVALSEETTFKDYKIIPFEKDTIYVDTTLTIKKDYKFNFIRKDDFELLPFHNQGQTFNKLGYRFDEVGLYPELGARAKHYNYYEIKDINHYQVATPFTELVYRKGLEQGQFLDALVTLNFNKRQNLSLNYKGLRSLGKYRNSLASHGNMRFTYAYQSKNGKYQVHSHLTAQELFNEESGGLTEESIINFETDNPDFKDRGRLETYFLDADNMLRANRYYINHSYQLLAKKDSISTQFNLKVGHVFKYETKHYQYNQTTSNAYFGESFLSKVVDKNHLTEFYNQLNVALNSNKILGNLKVFIDNYNYHFRFKNVVVLENQIVPQSLHDNVYSAGAIWNTSYKGIAIDAKLASTISGKLNGNYFKATGSYKKDSLFTLKATILNNSKSPNFNFLLNQSTYKAYNWQNTGFKNELRRTLLFELESNKFLDASAQITQLDNYTYFSEPLINEQTKPMQYAGTINYLKVKANKSISYKKFTLDNTLMYQKVADGDEVFRVPELVTRNTIYYSNSIFKKKPMYIQAGVTFKYFTKYFANAYNPLLSEFQLQNQVEIGNYPVFDVFVNARVRTMRLFLKAEHINTLFGKERNYYAAPNYPYRDYVLRFGVVWNFFI